MATARRLGCRRITSVDRLPMNHLTGVNSPPYSFSLHSARKGSRRERFVVGLPSAKKESNTFTQRIIVTTTNRLFPQFLLSFPLIVLFQSSFYREGGGKKKEKSCVVRREIYTIDTACICLQVHKRSQCFTN